MVSGVRISDGSPKECYPNFSFLMVFSGTQENTDRDKSLPVFFYFKKSLSRTLFTTSSIVGQVVLYIFKHTPDVPSMRNTFQWFFFSSTVNSFPFLTIYNDIASYNIFHIIVQCFKKVNTKNKRPFSRSLICLLQIFRRSISYKVLAAVVDDYAVPCIPVSFADSLLNDLYGLPFRYVEKSLTVLRLCLASQRKRVGRNFACLNLFHKTLFFFLRLSANSTKVSLS